MTIPYQWIVTITPQGVYFITNSHPKEFDIEADEQRVLEYLIKQTEAGSQELATMNRELNWNPSATRQCVKRLQSEGLVTVKFIHDMQTNLSD